MAINSVDMDRALTSASYAQQVIRSGNATAEERGQLIAKWGAENVSKWASVDTTEYQIDDESKNTAKEAGKNQAKESADNFDGKADNTESKVTSAVSAAGGIGGTVMGVLASIAALSKSDKYNASPIISAVIGAVLLANAIYLKSAKPNKDAASACDDMNTVMGEAQSSLEEAKGNMSDASEEVTELSEEAEAVNEDANKKMEEDKALFDFYREQYLLLKEKAESGEPLTADEKALMDKLAPLMQELGDGIEETCDETSETVKDLNSDIGEYQEVYDESAETVAEVQGATEYAAGFDEDTESNASLVKNTAMIGTVGSAGIVTAGFRGLAYVLPADKIAGAIAVAEGTASGLLFASVMSDQGEYQTKAEVEIDSRKMTEDINTQTEDLYNEELENYAGNIEVVEDLELEIPEDMEIPEETPAPTGEDAANPFVAANADNGDGQIATPAPTNTDNSSSNKTSNDNRADKKVKEDEK